MNETGREFGMTGSHFTNATGWPDPDQRVTARDLATLAKRTILDHPEYYHYYGEKEFTWSRSEEHTSELQSLMRISYAVFCLKKKNTYKTKHNQMRTYTQTHQAHK